MKILHVIPSLSARDGGPSEAAIGMCRALETAGNDAVIATTDSDGAGRLNVSIGVESRFDDVRVLFFRRDFGIGFKYSRALAVWLNGHVREFDLVNIDAVFNHSSVVAARASRRFGVPYIIRPAGTLDPWSLRRSWLRKWIFLKVFGRRMLGGASRLHFTTEMERARTLGAIGEYPSFVLPLGVAAPMMNAKPGSELEIETPYILFLSRIAAKKNIPVLIEAFAKSVAGSPAAPLTPSLSRSGEGGEGTPSWVRGSGAGGGAPVPGGEVPARWTLVIAGDGEAADVESLKKLAAKVGIADRVIFTGWLEGERKQHILSKASLFVLPSLHENFGLAVAEAMAAGVPVLLSPGVALAAEVEQAGAGWVAEPTAAAIAEALTTILADRGELDRRGESGRRFAAENFRWDRIAERLMAKYEEILEQRQGCPSPLPSPDRERVAAPKAGRVRGA